MSLPVEPPKIDWSVYRNKIAVAGLVDSFEKQYSAVKIPFPEDKYTSAIDKIEKEIVIIFITFITICIKIFFFIFGP